MDELQANGVLISASNEPSDCVQAFGDCRKGQILRPLGHFKFGAALLVAEYLISTMQKDCLHRRKDGYLTYPFNNVGMTNAGTD